jgi:hypothetical protein
MREASSGACALRQEDLAEYHYVYIKISVEFTLRSDIGPGYL